MMSYNVPVPFPLHTEEKKALKYNKAQEESITKWAKKLDRLSKDRHGFLAGGDLKEFLEEFTSIDSAPDPVTYKISVNDEPPGFRVVYSGFTTEEEAQDTLRRILKEIVVSKTTTAEYKSMAIWDGYLQLRKLDGTVVNYRIDKE